MITIQEEEKETDLPEKTGENLEGEIIRRYFQIDAKTFFQYTELLREFGMKLSPRLTILIKDDLRSLQNILRVDKNSKQTTLNKFIGGKENDTTEK